MASNPLPPHLLLLLFPPSDLFYRVHAEYSRRLVNTTGSPARPDLSLFFGAPLLRGFRAVVIVPPIMYQRAKLSVKSKRHPDAAREILEFVFSIFDGGEWRENAPALSWKFQKNVRGWNKVKPRTI